MGYLESWFQIKIFDAPIFLLQKGARQEEVEGHDRGDAQGVVVRGGALGLPKCEGRPRGGGRVLGAWQRARLVEVQREAAGRMNELEKLVHEPATTMKVNMIGGNYAAFVGWARGGLVHNVVRLALPPSPRIKPTSVPSTRMVCRVCWR